MTTAGVQLRGYRPWLDGVRAVAVTLVVCRHLGLGWASHAGGPGVGLFFALSGYLITGLLLDERARCGRVDLAAFYVRRAARLLPALVVMLAVSDVWFAMHGREVVGESLAMLLYVKNYRDLLAGSSGLFGHGWSLAVEEHFYLLWPVLLLLLLRRRSPSSALRVALGVCLLSLVWRAALFAVAGTGEWLYVDTLSRADSLLFGCALAMAMRHGVRIPTWMTLAAGVAFAWVVSPVWHPQPVEQTIGYTVQSVVCAILVAGLDQGGGRLRGLLSSPPVVRVGVLSYGIYLWHIPVLAALTMDAGAQRDVLAVGITLALALASYVVIERPSRLWVGSAHQRWRTRRARRARVPEALRGLTSLVFPHGTGTGGVLRERAGGGGQRAAVAFSADDGLGDQPVRAGGAAREPAAAARRP